MFLQKCFVSEELNGGVAFESVYVSLLFSQDLDKDNYSLDKNLDICLIKKTIVMKSDFNAAKGGFISERFSLWLQSQKKGAKSLF